MFVVTGVTGNTGSVAARALLERGEKTRVVVRDRDKGKVWEARGAEVAIASLDDAPALERALSGAKGAYLLSPPENASRDLAGDARRRFERVAQAVRAAGLPHVVLLSSIGADLPSGNGPIASLFEVERLLAAAAPLTAIRAGYFQENWALVLPAAKQDGVLPSFVPEDVPVPTVATEDIGHAAAEALIAGPGGVRAFELAGPREVTPKDVAEAASSALGRSVSVALQPLSAAVPTFTAFGISEHVAELYREMYAWLATRPSVGRSAPLVRGRIGIGEGIARLAARL
jgi:uncharacterized protein YbjT (DUF2867 family)